MEHLSLSPLHLLSVSHGYAYYEPPQWVQAAAAQSDPLLLSVGAFGSALSAIDHTAAAQMAAAKQMHADALATRSSAAAADAPDDQSDATKHDAQQHLLQLRVALQGYQDRGAAQLKKQLAAAKDSSYDGLEKYIVELKTKLQNTVVAVQQLEECWRLRWPEDGMIPAASIPSAADWWRFLTPELPVAQLSALRTAGGDRLTKDREWVLSRPAQLRAALLLDIEYREAVMQKMFDEKLAAVATLRTQLPPPPYSNHVTRKAVQQSLLAKLRLLNDLHGRIQPDFPTKHDMTGIDMPAIVRLRVEQVQREWTRVFAGEPLPAEFIAAMAPAPKPTVDDLQGWVCKLQQLYSTYQQLWTQRTPLLAAAAALRSAVGADAARESKDAAAAAAAAAVPQLDPSSRPPAVYGFLQSEKALFALEREVAKLFAQRPAVPDSVTEVDLTIIAKQERHQRKRRGAYRLLRACGTRISARSLRQTPRQTHRHGCCCRNSGSTAPQLQRRACSPAAACAAGGAGGSAEL